MYIVCSRKNIEYHLDCGDAFKALCRIGLPATVIFYDDEHKYYSMYWECNAGITLHDELNIYEKCYSRSKK